MFQGIDHHWQDSVYTTCGDQVDIWHKDRSAPVRSYKWGVDTVHSVKFNPVEVKYVPSIFFPKFRAAQIQVGTVFDGNR